MISVDVIRVAQGKRKIATGTLRPDIVLYNENHPFGDAIGRIQLNDLQKSPDVLLVMGTSLKVHGLRLLVRKVAKTVHENKRGCVILVNKTPVVGKEWSGVFDYFIEGETDRWCHIVEDAFRKVKVQIKLPFKVLTPEQKEQQKQKQKQKQQQEQQEQEQQSDKENHVPVERSQKSQATVGKKRTLSVALEKRFSEEQLAESITTALGATGLCGNDGDSDGESSSSTSNNSSTSSSNHSNSTTLSILSTADTNQDRIIATCRRKTPTARPLTSTTFVAPQTVPSCPPSPRKQNTLTSMSKASLHVTKASVRRQVLVKPAEKAMRIETMPELRRTRSATKQA
ncbi:hypothetical protein BG004_007108 [Podila humilis]|nr:hypothetical protein BG004_007108 [Podila humilis]